MAVSVMNRRTATPPRLVKFTIAVVIQAGPSGRATSSACLKDSRNAWSQASVSPSPTSTEKWKRAAAAYSSNAKGIAR